MASNNRLYDHLQVDGHGDRWYIAWPDGTQFSAQRYKRAQDAKGELTKLRSK